MAQYTKSEIANYLGISPRNVQFWVDLELVIPAISPRSGRGKALLFSETNLVQFNMAIILRESGISLGTIAAIFENIRRGELKGQDLKDFFKGMWRWGNELELVYWESKPKSDSFGLTIVEKTGSDAGTFKLPVFPENEGLAGYLCLFLGRTCKMAWDRAARQVGHSVVDWE
jgi:DNA-binding transcriptional MerR regulator